MLIAGQTLTMLSEATMDVDLIDTITDGGRLAAIVAVDGQIVRRVEVREIDGIWTAWQAIAAPDGWSHWLRIVGLHAPRSGPALISFCRELYAPMTRVS